MFWSWQICGSRFQSFRVPDEVRVQEANYQDQYHYKRYVDTYSNSNLLGRIEKKRDPNINNQCHFYATTATSTTYNMHICIGHNCHVLITMRFICTNPIKYDVYLLYFICINNHVISIQLTRKMLYEHLVNPYFNNDFISMYWSLNW